MITLHRLTDPRGLKGDLLGGLTTAIVSLPMALAFGVASGAGAEAGLYGAILVGFWAAFFGGTNTLISEPTGPMTLMITTVMTGIAARHPEHTIAMGFTVVVVAGCFQIVFGALKLGRYITLMPYSVISGFMSGIGVLLMVLQIPSLLGHSAPPGGAPRVLAELPRLLAELKGPECILGALSLAVLLLQPASWRRKVPPQLTVLILASLFAWIFFRDGGLRTIGTIPMGWPEFRFPVFTADMIGSILVDGLLLAVLGCIDTVLTAMIADSLTRTQHKTDQELIGQGVANLFSGLFGGLPGAGATMGTVVNIQSGAVSPRAGLVRAVTLLLVVVAAGPWLENVPMVALAAITFSVGLNILDWSYVRRVHRVSTAATLIMYGVMIVTVLVDIMVAVGVGVFIANLLTIDQLTRLQSENIKTVDPASLDQIPLTDEEKTLFAQGRGQIVIFHLSGPMIFGVAKAIAMEKEALKDARVLIIDLIDVPILSSTVGLAMENVVRDAESAGCTVIIAGAQRKIRERMERLDLIGPGATAFSDSTRVEALARALRILEETAARPSADQSASAS